MQEKRMRDDAISRQAAMDFVGSMEMCDEISVEAYQKLMNYLEELPSAQPETHDCISRQATIDAIFSEPLYRSGMKKRDVDVVIPAIYEKIKSLPPAQPSSSCVHENDSISRQAAIDAMANTLWHYPSECYRNLNKYEFAKGLAELGLKSVPSAQPDDDKLKRCRFEYINACKILAHRTPDTRKKDIDDAYAIVSALNPIFGDAEF